MVKPRELSRHGYKNFDVLRWNAFVDLIAKSNYGSLTSIQRIAYLGFWYDSEVQNGGHDQFFGSTKYFDYHEVISALEILGAGCQAKVFEEALVFYRDNKEQMPQSYEGYVKWDKATKYTKKLQEFDLRYYSCNPELCIELLDNFLTLNEKEFIVWID